MDAAMGRCCLGFASRIAHPVFPGMADADHVEIRAFIAEDDDVRTKRMNANCGRKFDALPRNSWILDQEVDRVQQPADIGIRLRHRPAVSREKPYSFEVRARCGAEPVASISAFLTHALRASPSGKRRHREVRSRRFPAPR